ncbi:MAG: HEAT repeat domain-containing protein [Planctomycetota bacterium]
MPSMLGLIAAGLALTATPQEALGDPERGHGVAAILDEGREREIAAPVVAERLVALGHPAVEDLLDVHRSGVCEGPVNGQVRLLRPLDEHDREAIYIALRANDWDAVALRVQSSLAKDPSVDECVHALRLWGEIAPARDLVAILDVASANESGADRRVRETFAEAIGTFIERDRDALLGLRTLYLRADPSLLAPIVDAVGDRRDHESLHALVRLLGLVPEVDTYLLVQIAESAKSVLRPVPAELLSDLRPALRRESRGDRIEAVRALARLDDVDAVTDLIALLEDRDNVVADEARRALEQITGERLGSDAAIWSTWHDSAVDWLHDELPVHVAAMRGDDPARTGRALLRIARYRIFRHDLVGHVAETLHHENDDIAALGCSVLGHLGTQAAVVALVDALDHPSTDVGRAAYEALRRITGEDRGTDPEDWRAEAE